MDLWLRGGLIVDGTGRPPFRGSVGICGDTIEIVTDALPDDLSLEIDCTGLIVTPGFVDIHTHSDLSFFADPQANSKVAQGVTTEVVGNCGFSAFPADARRRAELSQLLRGISSQDVDILWKDFDGYATILGDRRPIMNVAPLVGHGAIRIAASGLADIPMTEELMARQVGLLNAALDQGAFGLSTGLTYVPSGFATPEEIHELARVVRAHGALYATHARATAGFGAFSEAIEVARTTGARVQFSHVALNDPQTWGQAANVLAEFQAAVDASVDVRYDVYPYEASSSSLSQYLPGWTQQAGEEGLRSLIRDRRLFARAQKELALGLYGTIPWRWDRVVISLAGEGDEDLVGTTVADAASSRAVGPEELVLDLCARHGNSTQVILFYRHERDVADFLAHPLAIIGSDGSAMSVAAGGRPHPRNFGAHARLLERYVVDTGRLTLAEAVHKSTAAAADRIGIPDRGRISAGARADIVVLDLNAIRERATWHLPCQLAEGVKHVWINGESVVTDEMFTGTRPGRVLRRG
ncbi:D-aminoacylase [Saccharomonospora sp. NPDC046836]|uniref:N-acyl-D-amino-acid deacylase family protein n=1 Tax=Saccharomonospora sp. NPDC046836 TaxID=3156921 RepID=UPI00340215CD